MKNIKKIIVIIMVLLLCGCASKAVSGGMREQVADSYYSDENPTKVHYTYSSDGSNFITDPDITGNADTGNPTALPSKVIVKTSLEMESNDLTKTLELITEAIEKSGGYIQASKIYNDDSYSNHSAYLVVRVPADRYDEFMKAAEDYGNVLSVNTSTDDITTSYYDLQSRLESLKQQRERVLEFYKQATTIEELILIEQRLSEIDSEIAAKEITMKNYNLLTEYSTVIFDISEVGRFTDTRDTFLTRLKNTLSNSFTGFLYFLEEALFFVINSFWYVLLLIGIILLVSSLNRKFNFLKKPVIRRKKESKESEELIS